MKDRGVLANEDENKLRIFVEYGAGRAGLSAYVADRIKQETKKESVHAFIIVSNWTVQCVATNHVDSYENPNPINIDDEPVTQQHTHNDNVPNREDLHWRQAQLAAPLFSTQGTFPSYTTFAFHLAGSPYKDAGA